MNINDNQTETFDYCTISYRVEGQEVVNNYKCNQHLFSTSDLWRIRRSKKEFTINTGFGIN